MKKITENIRPQNATYLKLKECNASVIEHLGYGAPIPIIKEGNVHIVKYAKLLN